MAGPVTHVVVAVSNTDRYYGMDSFIVLRQSTKRTLSNSRSTEFCSMERPMQTCRSLDRDVAQRGNRPSGIGLHRRVQIIQLSDTSSHSVPYPESGSA